MWVALAGRGHSQSGVTFRGKVKRCPKAPPLQVQPTQLRHPPSILHGFRGARRRPSQHPRPQGTPPLGFTPYKSPQSFLHSQRPVEAKGREERQPRPHPGRHQSPTCPPRAGEPCAQCIPSTRSRFPPSQGPWSHRPSIQMCWVKDDHPLQEFQLGLSQPTWHQEAKGLWADTSHECRTRGAEAAPLCVCLTCISEILEFWLRPPKS